MGERISGHGGDLALAVLRAYGVTEMFTLSGGHVFPLYDAAHRTGVRIVDVRHEQTAVFAAEATAKLTRRPALAVLTAGPGVTNGVSAVTTADFNASPVVVLGGRAPQFRWGAGSLQEFDHVPVLAPITRWSGTATATDRIPADLRTALTAALTPHRGPVFLDIPMDVIFSSAEVELPDPVAPAGAAPDPDELAAATALIGGAQRPVVIAGSDVWGGGAEAELRAFAETHRLPVYANGMGRGLLGSDHELSFARSRRTATKGADVVVVVGAPLDFRLSFGDFGDARVVHLVDADSQRSAYAKPAVTVAGDLRPVLAALADAPRGVGDRSGWLGTLGAAEAAARSADERLLGAEGTPIRPARIYGELRRILERDAVIVCDGGDFVSYAGRFLDVDTPGCWLDPGPYGCLGTGAGYAIAASVARPDAQICLLYGDGAAGFSLMDAETMARHRLPVVMVLGNNGIWGLEKHPMRAVYGYDVAAELQPELRYDQVVSALGGAGETVREAADLGPALRRAFAQARDARQPYLVNVLTDPADAYPRSAVLA
jgi:acetolactate synthase-1/2/3 large subunit